MKHVGSRDPDLLHDQIAIVLAKEADFGANVSHFDVGQGVVLLVADGHNERVDPVLLIFDPQLCIHQGVSGQDSQIPRPVLGCLNRRSVDDELVGLLIEGCGR